MKAFKIALAYLLLKGLHTVLDVAYPQGVTVLDVAYHFLSELGSPGVTFSSATPNWTVLYVCLNLLP